MKLVHKEVPVELLIKTVVRRALMRAYEESYAMVILQKLLQDVRPADLDNTIQK